MGLSDFIADQLRRPSGFFGRHVATRFMSWASADINVRLDGHCAIRSAKRKSLCRLQPGGPDPRVTSTVRAYSV